jgi:hypothetical protein
LGSITISPPPTPPTHTHIISMPIDWQSIGKWSVIVSLCSWVLDYLLYRNMTWWSFCGLHLSHIMHMCW